jgi:hypothetical protein
MSQKICTDSSCDWDLNYLLYLTYNTVASCSYTIKSTTMRLSLLQGALFASSAVASYAGLATRQYASLTDSLKKLNTKIVAFDTQLKTLAPNSSAETFTNQVIPASEAVLTAFKDTAAAFSAAPQFQVLYEAFDFIAQVQNVTNNSEEAIDSLISKKDVITKLGQGEVVRKQLEREKVAVDTFAKAVNSKLYAALKPASDAMIGELVKVLNKGLAAFA